MRGGDEIICNVFLLTLMQVGKLKDLLSISLVSASSEDALLVRTLTGKRGETGKGQGRRARE